MAVRVPEPDAEFAGEQRSPGEPALTTALALATVLLVLLLANGRPALAMPPRLPATVRGALPVDETAAALAGLAVHAPPFGLTEPFGPGAAALLASPGKGALLFAPAVLVALRGVTLAFRYGERWLAGSFVLAALAHALLMGCAGDWAAGEAWG